MLGYIYTFVSYQNAHTYKLHYLEKSNIGNSGYYIKTYLADDYKLQRDCKKYAFSLRDRGI